MSAHLFAARVSRVAYRIGLVILAGCGSTPEPTRSVPVVPVATSESGARPTPSEAPLPSPAAVRAWPPDLGMFAVGVLYEYAGYRPDIYDDEIDVFAADAGDRARVFARYLEQLAREQGIDTEIVVRPGEGGCTEVVSRTMRDHLVSLYRPSPIVPRSATSPDRPAIRMARQPALLASLRLLDDADSKLSYLGGVRLRCGRGESLSFANSPHKVELVRELLIELGCQAVEVRRTPRGHYPTIATVTYRPSPAVAAMFDRVDREIEAARL